MNSKCQEMAMYGRVKWHAFQVKASFVKWYDLVAVCCFLPAISFASLASSHSGSRANPHTHASTENHSAVASEETR